MHALYVCVLGSPAGVGKPHACPLCVCWVVMLLGMGRLGQSCWWWQTSCMPCVYVCALLVSGATGSGLG